MKVIFSKQKDSILISRSIKKEIKREVEKALIQQLGKHVSTFHEIPVKHPTNPALNGYSIYAETKEQHPQEFFKETIQWGTNYFFGVISIKNSRKKFFFLADIKNPLSVGNEKILLEGIEEIKVYIKH